MTADVRSCLVPGRRRLTQQPDASRSRRGQALTRGVDMRSSKQSIVFQAADGRLGHAPESVQTSRLTKGSTEQSASTALRYA